MKVILAIDGSQGSDAAVTEVSCRPWPADTEVRVIRVVPPMDRSMLPHSLPSVFDELDQQQNTEAYKQLSAAVETLQRKNEGLKVFPVLREGWPKEAILQEADDWDADLIVIGSHGKGALKRMLLGSVSLTIAMSARCSVQIVRQRNLGGECTSTVRT